MGVRCRDCSRLFDGTGGLVDHECEGNNVTVLVINPGVASEYDENPARVFEDREEAESVAREIDAPTRMIDAPLIPAKGDEDG